MSKSQVVYKHYLRALSRWPQDTLRPECQFKDLMRKRVDKIFLSNTTSETSTKEINEKSELEQVNALYNLLENRFSQRVRLQRDILAVAFHN
ncbi:hypothetical protein OnM2_077046 [Erysiphe neolycopersici]|uniref:Mitochondrial nucleoid factor 1 n=1 Tax=Erysiphe neolycopersici TaxID=212602 RepID=A0A420HHV9_9PEZI|nr:hypothetical protein OnM2_077046 [Erysiphe neolycopersici]